MFFKREIMTNSRKMAFVDLIYGHRLDYFCYSLHLGI